jgi:hypothetical protein
LTLVCPDTESACLTILPALTLSLPNALFCVDSYLVTEPLPVLTLSLPNALFCVDSYLVTEPLPVLTSRLFNALYSLDSDLVYERSPVPDLPSAYPLCYNKYQT